MVETATLRILEEVRDERERQEQLKANGRFRYTCADTGLATSQKLAILVEEVGEAARAILEMQNLANDLHHSEPAMALRKELIQVAAVAVAWAESLP